MAVSAPQLFPGGPSERQLNFPSSVAFDAEGGLLATCQLVMCARVDQLPWNFHRGWEKSTQFRRGLYTHEIRIHPQKNTTLTIWQFFFCFFFVTPMTWSPRQPKKKHGQQHNFPNAHKKNCSNKIHQHFFWGEMRWFMEFESWILFSFSESFGHVPGWLKTWGPGSIGSIKECFFCYTFHRIFFKYLI